MYLLLVLVAACAGFTPSSSISFQIHSYDDMGQWDAALVKGVQWMKLDTHFVPRSNCSLFPQHKCTANGMLLLSHDAPWLHNVTFADSFDLLAWLRTRLSSIRGLTIALCGKGAPGDSANATECATHAHWRQYLGIYDAFIGELQALQRSGLDVEFLLDGDLLVSDGCRAGRWMPWNATWVAWPPVAYELDNDTFGRYQVFNVPEEPPLEMYALTHYGKFSRQQRYPYVVWEPSDQSHINAVSDTYVNHALHLPTGLRFAINISPERFQVYNADFSGTAWNVQLYKTGALVAPAAFPLFESNRIVVLAWNSNASRVEAAIYSYAAWFGAVTPVAMGVPVDGGAATLKSLESVARVNATTFVACDASGTAVTLTVAGATVLSSAPRPFPGASTRVFWIGPTGRALRATSSCQLQLDSAGPCLVDGDAGAVLDASAATLGNGTLAVAWAAADRTVHVAICGGGGASCSVRGAIGVGTSVSVSAARDALLVTSSDAYCWNNEYNNKEVVNVCAIRPTSTPGVLAYWYAPVANWITQLSGQPISVCNARVAHASFDQGSASHATLALEPKTGALRMLEVHVGASSANQFPTCGVATEWDGLVIDSFDIAKYSFV